ncbi:MAG: hypothetical protein A3J74_07725 [Elusimicrobia bacterium RIFCSPHIGHO2_02_FULL_57_9]|nr:MAG: hypothetical protein A3J74_07725 [Elusimicrobia bacterium RIFCSPHIGHO2_02_FULL_57_9]
MIAFGVIALTLLSMPLSAPVRAFKACAVYVLDPIAFNGAQGAQRLADIPVHARNLLVAAIENQLLRQELKSSDWTRAEVETLRAENERLNAALGLKVRLPSAPIWAHVMERDPLHWYRSVMVDAGGEQGVALNAPVLGSWGGRLVALGRVIEVRPQSSLVRLVTDELSSVAVYLTSPSTQTPKNLEGLLQGQGISRLLLNYLPPEAVLEKGDLVYSSPTSATFPSDILVGVVSKIFPRDPFLTFHSVEVEPAVEASQLQEVMILKTRQAHMASRTQ